MSGTYHCEGPAILAVDRHIISFENGNLQTPYYECQNDLGNVKDQFKERNLLRIELPSLPAHCCQSVMTSRGVLICPGLSSLAGCLFQLATPRCGAGRGFVGSSMEQRSSK